MNTQRPKPRLATGQNMATLYSRRTRFDSHTPRSVLIKNALDDWDLEYIDYEDDPRDYDEDWDY